MKEWLLVTSGVGLILTSIYIKRFPKYSIDEIEVLFLLFVLFLTVNGLLKNRAFLKIAYHIEKGSLIPLKLILATFFLSMLVTNDISLLVIVPLTLSLNINKKDLLVIFEALAANAGSALTPIGNPQNLFIYWFYNVSPSEFIKTIAPFSLMFLVLLISTSFTIRLQKSSGNRQVLKINKKAYVYVALFAVVLLAVFRIIPIVSAAVVILFVIIFDRKTLNIDYALLLSFLFFFGIADNLSVILRSEIAHSGHIFIFSALASQIMSNVPAALLFANFTHKWQALLWGVNAGGFGSLFGSLANLIAYKIYVKNVDNHHSAKFTLKFLALGYIAFFISVGLYFLLYSTFSL